MSWLGTAESFSLDSSQIKSIALVTLFIINFIYLRYTRILDKCNASWNSCTLYDSLIAVYFMALETVALIVLYLLYEVIVLAFGHVGLLLIFSILLISYILESKRKPIKVIWENDEL